MTKAFRALGVALVAVMLAGFSWTQAFAAAAPTAQTSSGDLQGITNGTVDAFRGIRYAAPPLGNLRLAPTQPAATMSGPVDASRSGRQCLQTPNASTAVESEDCLFLDITRPAGTPDGPLPVIVWWHGGGFVAGSGSWVVPNRLVARGKAIVVTVNYRLGDLGYLALPGVAGGGNFGFADQLESLRWVRKNIAAFGGDAANITIAGESAGALSVCLALVSPAAKGLFDKAIMSSGACTLDWAAGSLGRGIPRWTPFIARTDSEAWGVNRAAALGCSGSARLTCLRTKPASTFVNKPSGVVIFSPAFGTGLVPTNPVQALRTGAVNSVPVLSGSNHDEARLFIGPEHLKKPYTAAEYSSILQTAYGGNAGRVAQTYPTTNYSTPGVAWSYSGTDGSWSCPTQVGNRLTAARMPVYAYEFSDLGAPTLNPAFPYRAYHGVDLHYVFDTSAAATLSAPQRELGDTMIAYWTNFARAGDPNADGLPAMPKFDGGNVVTSLKPGTDGIRPVDFNADHKCSFWSTINATAARSAA